MSTSSFEDDVRYVASDTMSDDSKTQRSVVDTHTPFHFYSDVAPASIEFAVTKAVIIQILVIIFNIPVFIYYRKQKEITRPYILSLVALDFLLGIVTVTSYVVLFTSQSVAVVMIAFKVFYITFVFGFGFYLYPSFYLALDRFLVVLFPLKFREYSGKLRGFKIVWFLINFSNRVSLSVARLMYGDDNLASQLASAFSSIDIITLTLATFVLYVVMVVQIIRSNKKMTKSRAKNKSPR